jgi:integrase
VGTNLSVNAVHCLFARIRLRTGIPVSAHRLRHTGATAVARQKMSLDDIRKKLGHTTTKATVGYIHLAEQLPTPDRSAVRTGLPEHHPAQGQTTNPPTGR